MKLYRKNGFTLIELLVTISIIVVLMGVMIPAINSVVSFGKKAEAQAGAQALRNSINSYYTRYNDFPIEVDDLIDSDCEILPIENGWEMLEAIADKNTSGVVLIELGNYKEGDDGEVLDAYGDPYVFMIDLHHGGTNYMSDGYISFENDSQRTFESLNGRKYRIKYAVENGRNMEENRKKDLDGDGDIDGVITVDQQIRVLYLRGEGMEEVDD